MTMINRNVQVILGNPRIEIPTANLDSISVDVSKIYTDVNGTIINKATLPVAQQVRIPFFLFNELDRIGGLYNFEKTIPLRGWKFVRTWIQGHEQPPILFNGLMDYLTSMKGGDLVIMYADDLLNPTYYCFVIIAKAYGSYGTLVSNDDFSEVVPLFKTVNLTTSVAQMRENFYICKYDVFSNVHSDSFLPKDYRRPDWKDGDFIIIPLEFRPNKYVGFLHSLLYDTDTMQFNLLFTKLK